MSLNFMAAAQWKGGVGVFIPILQMGTLKLKKNTNICPRPHSFAMETGKESESVNHSVISDSATPGTVARQAALFMGFPKQEYWGGLPFLSPGDLPNSGIKPTSPVSPALAGDSLLSEPSGEATGETGSEKLLASTGMSANNVPLGSLQGYRLCNICSRKYLVFGSRC